MNFLKNYLIKQILFSIRSSTFLNLIAIGKNENFTTENMHDICASIQARIVSILLNKLKKAAHETGIKNICIAGGVSANSGLRNAFEELGTKEGWKTYIPPFEYCTDNAAMIAITGYYKYLQGAFEELSVVPSARAPF